VASSLLTLASRLGLDAAGQASQDAGRLTLDIDGPWSKPTIRAIGDGSTEPGVDPAPH
jgi:hypothetical protein